MSYQELNNFLENNRVRKESQEVFYTHVSLIDPKGKFQINKDDFEGFWDIYSKFISSPLSKSKPVGVAERPQTFVPVLVDIDIKLDYFEDYVDGQKIIQDKHINGVVHIYHSVLRTIIDDCQDKHLICFVLEKPSYIKTHGDKEYIKNGFHLHFPNIFLGKEDHELHLIPRIKAMLDQEEVFTDLGFTSSNLLDKSYTRVPWLLYGSRKDKNMDTYRLTKIYNAEMCDIPLEEAFEDITIYDCRESKIEYTLPPECYLPQILSILPFGRQSCDINSEVTSIVNSNVTPKILREHKKYSELTSSEDLKKAAIFVNMLSQSRAEDRNEWINVGWILYNIGQGSREALELWLKFSSQCLDKFDEGYCIEQWHKMTVKNMGMGTLVYMARMDNPGAYSEYIQNNLREYIKNTIENSSCSHTDIAKTLHMKYGTEFKCISIAQNLWYQYKNHRWIKSDSGVGLSSKISDDSPGTILHTFVEKCKEFTNLMLSAANEGEKAMHSIRVKQAQKIISSLKSAPFKKNVMRECAEVFRDEEFFKRIDKNPHLIGFKNGVYDLKKFQFRDGIPEDYISLQMNVEYKDFSPRDSKVREIREFFEKIFPDKSIRDYFMDVSCNIFVGGNRQKHVYFWSGEGDNGKSVTQNIFEKMLGEYAVKLPTSLIVGKRTQASSACPELVRAGNGVRWAVLQEPDKKDVINIGILKELSGNDTFFARGLYKEGSDVEPMFKLVVICNDPPLIPHSDKATWNRIRVIPFESTFCDNPPATIEEQLLEKRFPVDRNFDDKIPEMTQALAWVLLEHRKNGNKCVEPEKVRMATAYYKRKNDIYRQFIDESVAESADHKLSLAEIYRNFIDWHKESLPGHRIPSKNDMNEYLTKYWGEPVKVSKIGNVWEGYKFVSENDEGDSQSPRGIAGPMGEDGRPEL